VQGGGQFQLAQAPATRTNRATAPTDRKRHCKPNNPAPNPGKGVSSSAALEVSVMSALAAAHGVALGGRELALLCQKVGVPVLSRGGEGVGNCVLGQVKGWEAASVLLGGGGG